MSGDTLSRREVAALDALVSGVGGLVFVVLIFGAGVWFAPSNDSPVVLTVFLLGYMVVYVVVVHVTLGHLSAAKQLSTSPPRPLRWLF